MLTERECEICGSYFMPKRINHIYCPDCSRNSSRLKARAQKNLERIAITYRDVGVTENNHICKQCRKEFKSPLVIQEFCSGRCKSQHRIEHAVCSNCGKNLLEAGIKINEKQTRGLFCSDKCREEHKWKAAREHGNIASCPECGKEFIVPKGGKKYCSKECYLKANEALRNKYRGMKKCFNCGNYYNPETGFDKECCSKECHNILAAKRKQHREKSLAEQKRFAEQKANNKKAAEEKYIRENGLCPICKTSYKDCERMQSNFRLSPKGAVFEGSVIIRCPKFKK